MKKKLCIAFTVLALSASNQAFAASSGDVLSKLKDIQKDEQNSTSPVLIPKLSSSDSMTAFPTAAELKADLGDNAKDRLAELKAAAEKSSDAADYFKLAIADELTGDGDSGIDSLHKAISLAPDQKQMYEELVGLYEAKAPGKISVFVNGDKVSFKDEDGEVNPVIVDGSTLVPIRRITEKLGAKVDWDPTTLTASIRLLDTEVKLVQDSKNASVNGQGVTLEVPAQNIGGHILVPLRFISESFSKNVDYVPGDSGTAIIPIVDKK